MVQSKRNKVVSLTKVTKNPGEKKKQLVTNIRDFIEKYNYIYIFNFDNMRNSQLKQVRSEWSTSKILFGKNKVMSVGLGKSEEDEMKPNLHKVSENLEGECALFFTNEPKDSVVSYFNMFSEKDFPRSGFEHTETITLKEGPIPSMTHSMEPYLRSLGLPTTLKNGVINLERDYHLCEQGVAITPDQAKLLQLFDYKISEFKFTIKGYWNDGEWSSLEQE
eukprot:gene5424-6766_t